MGTNAPFSTAPRPAIVDNAFSSGQQRGHAYGFASVGSLGQRRALLREPVNPTTLHSTLRWPITPLVASRIVRKMPGGGDSCLLANRVLSLCKRI